MNDPGHMIKMAATPKYVKNPSIIFFSGTNRLIALKLIMKYYPLVPIIICSNDDPGMTLTFFTSRTILVNYGVVR